MCSYNGCDKKNVIRVLIMGIKFGYCKRHKEYLNRIITRQTKHRDFRKRFGIYELG